MNSEASEIDLPPLLAPDEAPAVEIVHSEGAAGFLLCCDHASRRVPRVLGDLGLPPAAFDRHIAWDIGAADVARLLSHRFDAPLVMSGYSRLVIDLNRRHDDPTSIPEVSDGVLVPANRAITPEERRRRRDALFRPYHATIEAALARLAKRVAVPAIVSIHSCTPVFKGFERPWHIGVLWNEDDRLARPLMARLAARGDVSVGDNQPYSARDGHGYTMRAHAEAPGLPHVLLEIRQDLIDTHRGAERWAQLLADELAPLLADPGLRHRRQG
ncbi:MAG TPA: N-formylglutamate amidohydrolase [Alphaproteobacteria bacterium]|nr:N-formylglutamate amidohydrolase [Alphaproteobacteria bacterium]